MRRSLFSSGDQGYTVEQYEVLRQEALGSPVAARRGHGFVLLVSRGMTAWIGALSALAPGPARTDPGEKEPLLTQGPTVASSVQSEIAAIMAGMVLACHQETLCA